MIRVFITGPHGCIGAATIRYLLDHGVDDIVGFSRGADPDLVPSSVRPHLQLVSGDLRNEEPLVEVLTKTDPTHIIHLAAYQTPDCEAAPLGGMEVNLIGTANVLKAAANLSNLQRVVFASSAAVYGPRSMYPRQGIEASAACLPRNLYGYWKLGGEGIAQAFHRETQIPTISLRLATVYGPGRDYGFTAAPTTAMKAAALGLSFDIPYTGDEHYHFVADVAAGFAQCAIEPFEGYGVFNLRGQTRTVEGFCRLVRQVGEPLGLPSPIKIGVAEDASPIPFPSHLNDRDTLAAFPNMPLTDLEVGIRESLTSFAQMAADGDLYID